MGIYLIEGYGANTDFLSLDYTSVHIIATILVTLATLLFPLFLFIFGSPDRGPILTGYLGALLQGSAFLAIPSAFTRVTGEAHWHTLIRARAIENGAFVFAAAQGGKHENGRRNRSYRSQARRWRHSW